MEAAIRTAAAGGAWAAAIEQAVTLRPKIRPRMATPDALSAPAAYRRFQDLAAKRRFSARLRLELIRCWRADLGLPAARRLARALHRLVREVSENGAAVFADLIDRERFAGLVQRYDRLMGQAASESLLHSYLNLQEHRGFLEGRDVDALFHPLVLILLAHALGAPPRLVDARAKDTGPMEVRAQDNMLHIDNTPFNDEYKVLLLWEKGRASGPAGQNFTFLPGAHRAARDCMIDPSGQPWSTENASIFVEETSLGSLLEVQRRVTGQSEARIVEVQDPDRPLTVVFAAGSLPHHRYRTAAGGARSCIILAFHNAYDTGRRMFGQTPTRGLVAEALSGQGGRADSDARFIAAAQAESRRIAEALRRLDGHGPELLLSTEGKHLDDDGFTAWFRAVTDAPEVEDIKRARGGTARFRDRPIEELLAALPREFMLFDKHGPLDLILYADAHEEVRKAARNRIREMPISEMERRLKRWTGTLRPSSPSHLMTNETVAALAEDLAARVSITPAAGAARAYRSSLAQLATDLAEAGRRPYSVQNFLSTGLFVFWAYDEAIETLGWAFSEAEEAGGRLLRHYVGLAMAASDLKDGR